MTATKFYKLALFFFCLSLAGTSLSCSNFNELSNPQIEEENESQSEILSSTYTRRVVYAEQEQVRIELITYAFDPEMVVMQLHQDDAGKRIEQWSQETGADIVINGAYFDEQNLPTGKFIIDGQDLGKASYDLDRSATLFIKDGLAQIIDTEKFELPEASNKISLLQSFPVLIKNGEGVIDSNSEKLARRTVIAQTKNSTMLLIIVDKTPVSLFELMNAILASDLDVQIALNLDGGQSTGIVAKIDSFSETLLPITSLPQVIGIKTKN